MLGLLSAAPARGQYFDEPSSADVIGDSGSFYNASPFEVDEVIATDAASDDPQALAARIKLLEDDAKKRKDADNKKKADDAKKKADDAKKPTSKWTGRIHMDYWAFPGTSPGANAFETTNSANSVDDRFLFRRVRVGIQGDIADNMQYKLEFDLNNPRLPQYKDMYIGWNELPLLQTVLIGNQKRPYGLDHLNSSRYNIFLERPDIIEAFNQDARRFGVCSYNQSENEAWNWRCGAYMSQDLQSDGIVTTTPITETYQAELAGRIANTFWYDEPSGGRYFGHLGVAGTYANTDAAGGPTSTARFQSRPEARTAARWLDTGIIAGADQYQLAAVEGLVNYGPFQMVGEFQHVSMQRTADSSLSFQGGYAYISYFLTGENMTWDRATGQLGRVIPHENCFLVRDENGRLGGGLGAWQVALRYSVTDLTDKNIAGGVGNEVTAALDWYWNPYARMQFNCIYGEIRDRRPIDGQTTAFFTILGTRFCVDF